MSAPPMKLGLIVIGAGAALAIIAGLLEIAITHQIRPDTTSDDILIFESSLLSAVTTASGFVLAVGVVMAVWAFAEGRGLVGTTGTGTRRSAR